jgi:KDO2-lipid IV(A) lauroyltransferase
VLDKLAGWGIAMVFAIARRIDRRRFSDFGGRFLRRLGPWLPEHRVGRDNLAAAFPEKSAAEIEAILDGVWDNLGRVAAELAHMDRLRVSDPAQPTLDDILYDPVTHERFHRLRSSTKPALIFAAHLANWEVPAIVAAEHKLDIALLYRRPNFRSVADTLERIRTSRMGTLIPAGYEAPIRFANLLAAGGRVAMLVDQYEYMGVQVDFFGRRAKANALIARLARRFECPIYGTRAVRLPDCHRFRCEITDEITPARDAQGGIDVQGTMQAITRIIEGWVREHPEQWLWLHRRWRNY